MISTLMMANSGQQVGFFFQYQVGSGQVLKKKQVVGAALYVVPLKEATD